MTETVPKTVLMGTASMAPLRPLGIRPRRAGEEPASYTGGGLVRLAGSWARLREKMDLAHTGFRDGGGTDSVEIDDRLVDPDANPGEDDVPLSLDALYVMLAFDDAAAPASDVLDAVAGVLGSDPQSKAFSRLWRLVGKVAEGLGRLTFDEPQFVLSLAWDATGVAAVWQRAALMNTPEGRVANDRLDVAMRLFQFAEGTVSGHDVESFIAQVRSMEIEADSLAHVSPVEQAVTLTTPAGAAGRRWRFVWLPAVPAGRVAEPDGARHPVRRRGIWPTSCCTGGFPKRRASGGTPVCPRCCPARRKACWWR